jgi:holo-[acyl-carrier protein] synthase
MLSVGIDLVETARIKATIERFKERFLQRVFTEVEIGFCSKRPNPFQSYAARFAAKEAYLKALGTGKTQSIRWRDVEIVDDEHSRPTIRLYGRARDLTSGNVHLSLSHTRISAVAVCIIERP